MNSLWRWTSQVRVYQLPLPAKSRCICVPWQVLKLELWKHRREIQLIVITTFWQTYWHSHQHFHHHRQHHHEEREDLQWWWQKQNPAMTQQQRREPVMSLKSWRETIQKKSQDSQKRLKYCQTRTCHAKLCWLYQDSFRKRPNQFYQKLSESKCWSRHRNACQWRRISAFRFLDLHQTKPSRSSSQWTGLLEVFISEISILATVSLIKPSILRALQVWCRPNQAAAKIDSSYQNQSIKRKSYH